MIRHIGRRTASEPLSVEQTETTQPHQVYLTVYCAADIFEAEKNFKSAPLLNF